MIFGSDIGSWLAWFFWVFVFFAYLMVLFSILGDLFRDSELNGWLKAIWIIFLIFVPFLTALVYLIARGNGMTKRGLAQAAEMKKAQDDYIRQTAGAASGGTSVDDIAKAKTLLDSGAITQAEFDAIKAKALAG
jgi:Short C-terminal domain/Phospholipase_D-nuclease N-terminal